MLEDECTLKDHDIIQEYITLQLELSKLRNVITSSVHILCMEYSCVGGMYIFVRMPSGEIITLVVVASDDIGSIKTTIQKLKEIFPDQQQLIFNEEALDDQFNLHDYGIQRGNMLELLTGKHIDNLRRDHLSH